LEDAATDDAVAESTVPAVKQALDLLARSAKSRATLAQALGRRHEPPDVALALERMEQLGLLDDRAWAENYVKLRYQRRGWGRERLVAELRSRGIEQELALSVVGRLVDDEGQEELARRLLESFLASRDRSGGVAADPVGADPVAVDPAGADPAGGDGVAAARYLARRGFDEDLVARLVEPLLAEQLEDPVDPHG